MAGVEARSLRVCAIAVSVATFWMLKNTTTMRLQICVIVAFFFLMGSAIEA